MIEGFVRNNLSCSKVVSASSDQEKRSEALRSLKKGSPFLSRCDMKRQSSHAACMLLYILNACWPFHVGDGGDLVRIWLDASCADNVAQEDTGWNSKDVLRRVQLPSVPI